MGAVFRAAEVAVQQVSELQSVPGIAILDLPKKYQQAINYTVTSFTASQNGTVARDFIKFLQSEDVKKVLHRKGLDPA